LGEARYRIPDAGWSEAASGSTPSRRGILDYAPEGRSYGSERNPAAAGMRGTEKNGGWERGGDKKMNIEHPPAMHSVLGWY